MGKRTNFLALSALTITLFTVISCKKVLNNPNNSSGKTSSDDTYLGNYTISHSIFDTLYMYSKAFYFWNSDLPNFETFNPVQYKTSDSLTGLQNELFAFTQIPIYDSTNKPYEYPVDPVDFPKEPKFSYIINTADNTNGGNASFVVKPNTESLTLDGKGNDMGISFGFYGYQIANMQDTTITTLEYVVNGSPAQKAGLKRGDIIYSMNGQAVDFDSFGSQTVLNSYYNGLESGNNLTIVTIDSLYPQSGIRKTTTHNLAKTIYNVNPIFKDSVITLSNGKAIGYIALENFTEMTNAKPYIDAAFAQFTSNNVSDIVVDLRYNGGGAVETSAYLANNLIPSGYDNKVLFTEYYNDSLRKDNFADQSSYSQNLKNVLSSQKLYNDDGSYSGYTALNIDYSTSGNTDSVKKVGNLNLPNNRVFFIVAGGTASASELLINSLKPYTNVILVGARYAEDLDNSSGKPEIRTYGKPVGFFNLRIGIYTVYMSMFETRNAQNQGGYYNGMLTNEYGDDDISSDFANSQDPYESLNMILGSVDPNYIVSGIHPSLDSYQLNSSAVARKLITRNIQAYQNNKIKGNLKIMIGKPKTKQ